MQEERVLSLVGIPNKGYHSSASPSKIPNSSRNIDNDGVENLPNNTDEDLVQAYVPNYVTYGWTVEAANAFSTAVQQNQ
jgi:hypothetical protein